PDQLHFPAIMTVERNETKALNVAWQLDVFRIKHARPVASETPEKIAKLEHDVLACSWRLCRILDRSTPVISGQQHDREPSVGVAFKFFDDRFSFIWLLAENSHVQLDGFKKARHLVFRALVVPMHKENFLIRNIACLQ